MSTVFELFITLAAFSFDIISLSSIGKARYISVDGEELALCPGNRASHYYIYLSKKCMISVSRMSLSTGFSTKCSLVQ